MFGGYRSLISGEQLGYAERHTARFCPSTRRESAISLSTTNFVGIIAYSFLEGFHVYLFQRRRPPHDPKSKAFCQYSSGTAFADQRFLRKQFIYTPSDRTPNFESLSCPITNILDSRVTAPFFGPNTWIAVLQPVPNGGLPMPAEIKLVFKDGGTFDFHGIFEGVKERVSQAQQDGRSTQLEHLENLPAYEESPVSSTTMAHTAVQLPRNDQAADSTPAVAPPGYEEVQRESVAIELERQTEAMRTATQR